MYTELHMRSLVNLQPRSMTLRCDIIITRPIKWLKARKERLGEDGSACDPQVVRSAELRLTGLFNVNTSTL